MNSIFYIASAKRSRDGGTLWVGGGVDEQLIMHDADEYIHSIIGHLFLTLEKDVKVVTGGKPVIIHPDNVLQHENGADDINYPKQYTRTNTKAQMLVVTHKEV